MLKYRTRNKVAIEIFGCFQNWKFLVALAIIPLLGLTLPSLMHLPELPQWFFWVTWLIMPVKKNLWARVISPTSLFIIDLVKIPILWMIFPILKGIWKGLVPLYHKTLGPYEEKLIKPVAIPVFIFLLFYEEIVLWALRKVVFPGVKLFIQIAPAWMIVTLFALLEIGKLIAKPLMFVAFANGLAATAVFFVVYFAVSFFSLQIMVHGSEKLRSFNWFNKLYQWAVATLGPIKKQAKAWWHKQAIYHWWKDIKEKTKENKNTLLARVMIRARSWKQKKTD